MAPMPTSRRHRHLPGPGTLALLAVLTQGAAALGEPIRYEYGGVITFAHSSTGVSPGTRFEGSFTYDPAVTPLLLSIEGIQPVRLRPVREHPGSVSDGSGLDLLVGGQAVLANPGGVQVSVFESEYSGQYGYRDSQGHPAGPFTKIDISNGNVDHGPIFVSLGLSNPGRSVFGSLAPPRAEPCRFPGGAPPRRRGRRQPRVPYALRGDDRSPGAGPGPRADHARDLRRGRRGLGRPPATPAPRVTPRAPSRHRSRTPERDGSEESRRRHRLGQNRPQAIPAQIRLEKSQA